MCGLLSFILWGNTLFEKRLEMIPLGIHILGVVQTCTDLKIENCRYIIIQCVMFSR